ncbi:MAG: leucine-rich repeat domain-containing protein [Phycisphaerae bacterium]|nr:leucine-rich repeat domain-containing protein [Phycisphaerae bacterium]
MKKGIFVLVWVFAAASLAWPADAVRFADAKLKSVVEKTLGVTDPTPEDMLKLTRLYAGAQEIGNLSGLEHAANLTSLCLHRNAFSDISAVAGLTKLSYLCLHDNAVEDISAVKGLTGLVNLLVYGNKISDLSPVAELTELTSLYAGGNRVTDISAVGNLKKLRFLDVSNNEIVDVSAASGLAELTDLRISGNRIANLGGLEKLERLKSAWVFDNPAPIPAQWIDGGLSVYLDDRQYAASAGDSATGKLAWKGEIDSFMVSRKNCFIRVAAADEGVELPAGEYRLAGWESEKKDAEGVRWKMAATSRAADKGAFTINDGQTETLEIGEPVVATLTANKGRSGYTFGQGLTGRMGESISIVREGARPAPPKLHVRNKDGSYDKTFSFEYG